MSRTKLYPKPRPVGSAAPASCSCALPSLQHGTAARRAKGRGGGQQWAHWGWHLLAARCAQPTTHGSSRCPANEQTHTAAALGAPEVRDEGVGERPRGRLQQAPHRGCQQDTSTRVKRQDRDSGAGRTVAWAHMAADELASKSSSGAAADFSSNRSASCQLSMVAPRPRPSDHCRTQLSLCSTRPMRGEAHSQHKERPFWVGKGRGALQHKAYHHSLLHQPRSLLEAVLWRQHLSRQAQLLYLQYQVRWQGTGSSGCVAAGARSGLLCRCFRQGENTSPPCCVPQALQPQDKKAAQQLSSGGCTMRCLVRAHADHQLPTLLPHSCPLAAHTAAPWLPTHRCLVQLFVHHQPAMLHAEGSHVACLQRTRLLCRAQRQGVEGRL